MKPGIKRYQAVNTLPHPPCHEAPVCLASPAPTSATHWQTLGELMACTYAWFANEDNWTNQASKWSNYHAMQMMIRMSDFFPNNTKFWMECIADILQLFTTVWTCSYAYLLYFEEGWANLRQNTDFQLTFTSSSIYHSQHISEVSQPTCMVGRIRKIS